MLVVTRCVGDSIIAMKDDDVETAIAIRMLSVSSRNGAYIRVGLSAPENIRLYRDELLPSVFRGEPEKLKEINRLIGG